jgi:hypothetical protein
MLFSELIASEDYKPRPNARSTDKDKVIQRLALNAHRAFEDAVAEGKVDVLNERHYVMASELVDAAGGKFDGRDRRLEDFNLDEGSSKTQAFIKEFFAGTRSYGKPKTASKPASRNPNLDSRRSEAQNALRWLWAANENMTKKEILDLIHYFTRSFNAYAEQVKPLKSFSNLPPLEDGAQLKLLVNE